MSDAEIVARVKQGKVQAYGTLVERYEQAVFATVLSLTKDRYMAEDVTQDVFTQGYLKLCTLRDDSRFAFWLMKIARRHARQALRQRNRLRALPIGSADESTGVGDDGRLLDEDKEHLLWHVQKLPVHERLTLSLRYFDGHSVQQIAEITGRPVGTVTKQLSRAIERLRKSFKQEKL
ncbi:MAG: RNA polymerase sigma factor [Planctomycetota bacterium]|jgi:RNA polymerase sigma-70 factor (ECF subfamily)